MTLKEADEAAQKGLPIIHQKPSSQIAVEYRRITRTGYKYAENGERFGFVELIDKNGNSMSEADPAHCKLKEEAIP